MKLPVFISWSGERSLAVANALAEWLELLLPPIKTWVSERDIQAGDFWDVELRKSIESARFGIACVVPECVMSPWVNYEAGALAEALKGKVAPYLFGVDPNDLKPTPLSRLWAVSADKAGTRKLVGRINETLGESALKDKNLDTTFELLWRKLETELAGIPQPEEPPQRTADDKLDEVLSLLHSIRSSVAPSPLDRAFYALGIEDDQLAPHNLERVLKGFSELQTDLTKRVWLAQAKQRKKSRKSPPEPSRQEHDD